MNGKCKCSILIVDLSLPVACSKLSSDFGSGRVLFARKLGRLKKPNWRLVESWRRVVALVLFTAQSSILVLAKCHKPRGRLKFLQSSVSLHEVSRRSLSDGSERVGVILESQSQSSRSKNCPVLV